MALSAGTLTITVHYGKDLKDCDLFSSMDPYFVITCGNQRFRSQTAKGAGRNPVWNESFSLNVINENAALVQLYDQDLITRDDLIGEVTLQFATARVRGEDNSNHPVITKSKKQKGFISVAMMFVPNDSLRAQQVPQQQSAGHSCCHRASPPYPYPPAPIAALQYSQTMPAPPPPSYLPQAPSYHAGPPPYGYAPPPLQYGYPPQHAQSHAFQAVQSMRYPAGYGVPAAGQPQAAPAYPSAPPPYGASPPAAPSGAPPAGGWLGSATTYA